jgi:hypothetical protein
MASTEVEPLGQWREDFVGGRTEPAAAVGTPRCVTVRRLGFAERASTSDVVPAHPPRAWSVCGIDGPIRALRPRHRDTADVRVHASTVAAASGISGPA